MESKGAISMRLLFYIAAAVTVAAVGSAAPAAVGSFSDGAVKAKSYSKLAFSPDGILFVGDSIGARIYALDLGDRQRVDAVKPLDVGDVEGKIAAMLGGDPRDVMIHDMAVNPMSKNIYLTVSRGRRSFTGQWQLPNDVANASVLLRVTPGGAIEEVRLDRVKLSALDIANPVNDKAEVDWKKVKQRVDTISDMVFIDGKLYVAGLSNEEFSSTMRIYPFPFDGTGTSTTLEIYHGAHAKWETDSPIRSFLPYRIQGKSYLMASYLCTPLVLFPLDSLKDKTHVKGTTIAELGYGNYPIDMVAYRSQGKDYVMIVNSTRGLMQIKAEDLQKPASAITTPVPPGSGTPAEHLRGQGVMQVENYGDNYLLRLARNTFTGEMTLSTVALNQE
jgi:hypothetical protein